MRQLLATGLLILLSATKATAAALPNADRDCRDALAKAVAHLTKAVMNEQVKCHATRMSGDPLFTALDCNDISHLPTKSQLKITKASDKLAAAGGAADKDCTQAGAATPPTMINYTTCPTPCEAHSVGDYAGLGACLECVTKNEASTAMRAVYGSMPPVVGKSPALTCQSAVGKAQLKYKLARMKEQRRCQSLQDANQPPTTADTDCESADLIGKVAMMRDKAENSIAKKCTAPTLASLSSCATDLTAEQECVVDSADQCAAHLFDAVYPSLLPIGGSRPATLHVPPSYTPGTSMPLVVLLHGYSADGPSQESYFQLTAQSDTRGFLYVYPDGTPNVLGERFWDATDACCNFSDQPVDDSAYISKVISDIADRYSVDPKRIYIVGHSNGGFMAHRMACDHADTVAAIVSLAGAMFDNVALCTPSEGVSVLQIHGTSDGTIAYNGGSLLGRPYPGATTTVADWASLNGCNPTPDTSPAPLNLVTNLAGAETSVARYATGCIPGGHAELWTINNGSHVPSLTANFAPSVVDFLLAHPKP